MFIIHKKPKLRELQSVVHFLIVASSLSYGYGIGSSPTAQRCSDGDPMANILGRVSRRSRQVEKLQNQSSTPKSQSFPNPIFICSSKKIYIFGQGSTTIH